MGPTRLTKARARRLGCLAILALAAGLDLAQAPERQVTAAVLVGSIELYQHTVSPLLGGLGARCRFEPTCSHYGKAVVENHGTLRGSYLALRRVARCGPWTPLGTDDPPPGGDTPSAPRRP